MKIILASTSKYRQQQMKDFGLSFQAIRPLFDEESFKQKGLSPQKKLSPRKLCLELARRKALSLESVYPNAAIIGADQLVAFHGRILGKPGSAKKAFQTLKQLSGKKHELITTVAVVYKGEIHYSQVIAKIWLRKLTDAEIKAYLRLDQPLDCAGSYKFEKAGLSLVSQMTCPDPSSLIGLPLISLGKILRSLDP